MAEIVNINGCDIRFEIHGKGIPMVYTPGGFWTLERGRAVAERLSPLGYKVLLWDRPNTGESGLLFEGDNLLQIWADKLRELLHHTGHSPAFISGGSAAALHHCISPIFIQPKSKGLFLSVCRQTIKKHGTASYRTPFWDPVTWRKKREWMQLLWL